jgi:hypothetical protein
MDIEKIAKKIVADMNVDEIIIKLSECFETSIDNVAHLYDNTYEVDGKEYLVYENQSDAYNAAVDSCKQLIEDCGVDCINGYENYVKKNYFDTMQENYYKEYCNDIKREPSDRFDNRLIDECYDAMIIYPSDFAYAIDENGNETDEIDFMNCLADEDQMIDNYVEYLCETEESYDWIRGMYSVKDLVKYYPNAFNIDAMAEYCVDTDGIAHTLSSYDGKEIKCNGLYLYRVN